ncbi:MAG: carbamoyl phosphate synthase large subunit, partial [Alphaproteobacteria bacterium]|nr:carbamoyl phosphate synthase large subunit [Alphaproteobacteria bacterium]
RALKVVGLMNVQFAVKGEDIHIIEVNPRASRTVPFVAKATGIPLAKIAARVMAGASLRDMVANGAWRMREESTPAPRHPSPATHVAVKEAVFPFARFANVDVILGPEMKSTGEAMGLDADFARAFAKSQAGAGNQLPLQGTVFMSVKNADKQGIVPVAAQLLALGFSIVATRGTAAHLEEKGMQVNVVNKVREGRPHIVDMLKDRTVALVINTTEGAQAIADSFDIRRTALLNKIPYYTTLAAAKAVTSAIAALKNGGGLEVKPLQEYFPAAQPERDQG